MIELNKPEIIEKPIDQTTYVSMALAKAGIIVKLTPSPLVHLETAGRGFCLEIVSRMADDLDYAIQAIIEAKPLVVFLREVTKEHNGYKFRYQYISYKEEPYVVSNS